MTGPREGGRGSRVGVAVRAWMIGSALTAGLAPAIVARAQEVVTPVLTATAGASGQGSGAAPRPLTLAEVLESVDRHFPLLQASRAAQERAVGENIAAQGGFDLKVGTKGATQQFGYYQNRLLDVFVEQPTTVLGAIVSAGYSIGRGNFPAWLGDLETLSDGEFRLGARVPLLRDRDIDGRRAARTRAAAGLEVADAELQKDRLTFAKEAASRYWEWVASGHQVGIARELLELAEQRVDQVAEAVRLGDLAAVENIDNRRAILERRSGVVFSEQVIGQAAIELGLYLRQLTGEPMAVAVDRLPEFPEPTPLDDEALAAGIASAQQRRPEIRALLGKQRQLAVDVRLADNAVAPRLDLSAEYSRDFGEGSVTKQGDELKAAFAFELPLQQRKGEGKQLIAEAKLRQVDAELRFARDRVRADVESAAVALRAAYDLVTLVREEVDVARQLQEAELERFRLGDSTLLIVNLRELSAASARSREIKVLASFHKAAAAYAVATGTIATPTP